MFVVIPVKPFHQSKSRLAPVLSPEQRINLSRRLLLRTLQLALQLGPVVVVSKDKTARQLAKQMGAWALVECRAGLNNAIRQANEWVAAREGQSVLIIPGDLPLLTLSDLTSLIALGEQSPAVVIAPCHRHNGTNGLLLHPPHIIEPAFGENSFARHLQAIHNAGIEPVIYQSPTVAFDLDYPEDLQQLSPEFFQIQL